MKLINNLVCSIVLIFSLQSLIKADDIRDFEIEGMSVGDSALIHFTDNDLEKGKEETYTYFYPENKYIKIAISTSRDTSSLYLASDDYDDLSITIKPNDKEYIIHALSGRIYCEDDINFCFELQNKVINDLSSVIKNAKENSYKDPHPADNTGKSFVHGRDFYFEENGSISISVYDWSVKMNNERNWQDSLQVGVNSDEFDIYLWNLY